jgi:hypothetical protein
VYFPLQLVFTSIFSRKCIIYYSIHGIRDDVRGLHTGKPFTGRMRVHAGRQGGEGLVFGAGKRLTRLESRAKYIFLFNFIKFNYLFCIYYLYIFSNLLFILRYIIILLFYIYKIFFFEIYFILF